MLVMVRQQWLEARSMVKRLDVQSKVAGAGLCLLLSFSQQGLAVELTEAIQDEDGDWLQTLLEPYDELYDEIILLNITKFINEIDLIFLLKDAAIKPTEFIDKTNFLLEYNNSAGK